MRNRCGTGQAAACGTVLALAIAATSGAVIAAEDDAVRALTKPDSEVRAGIGYVDEDNFRFGRYTGLNEQGVYGLLDIDLRQRDDAAGTWLIVNGRNLGLDSRSLRLEYDHQSDWRAFAEYSEIPRFNPYTHDSGLAGIGSASLVVNGTDLRDLQLETQRQRVSAGMSKWFGDNFSVDIRALDERKDGERMYGRGTPGAMEFLADPIDQRIRQFEAKVSYAGKSLQVAGGYYGTTFDNANTALNIAGGAPPLADGAGAFTPMALPPDNQSHQVFIAGAYRFAPTVAANFKAAYGRATQDDRFILPTTTGRTDLGGRIDTLSLQAGITAHPWSKLSLLANVRYEDRDDQTPVVDYFPVTVTPTATGENEPRDIETTVGRIEASYQLPAGLRLTAGVEDEIKHRNTSSVRVVSYRKETDEKSYRLELRRAVSETVTGSLGYVHSKRGGSAFESTVTTDGALGSNLVAPVHLADRERDKVRALVDWAPGDALSVQFLLEQSRDDYDGRSPLDLGVRSGRASVYSVDAGYALSDAWQVDAWVSRNDTRVDQATCVSASATGVCPETTANPLWSARLRNTGDSAGLGLTVKLTDALDAGIDSQYSEIRDEFTQRAVTPEAIVAPLPDIHTRLASVRVYARHRLRGNSALRAEVKYDRYSTDDWTWSTFTYLDGTHVTEEPTQRVYFFGLSYTHHWQ